MGKNNQSNKHKSIHKNIQSLNESRTGGQIALKGYSYQMFYHRPFGKGDEKGDEKAIKKYKIIMRAEAALRIIEDNPIIPVNELASALNVTRKQTENALKRLKEDGRIHRERSDCKGKWIIRRVDLNNNTQEYING